MKYFNLIVNVSLLITAVFIVVIIFEELSVLETKASILQKDLDATRKELKSVLAEVHTNQTMTTSLGDRLELVEDLSGSNTELHSKNVEVISMTSAQLEEITKRVKCISGVNFVMYVILGVPLVVLWSTRKKGSIEKS